MVVGASFAGIYATKKLVLADKEELFDILLIDKNEFFEYICTNKYAFCDEAHLEKITLPYT